MVEKGSIPGIPQTHNELIGIFGREIDPDSFILFNGNDSPRLAENVSNILNTPYYGPSSKEFPDHELDITLQEGVRGKEVVIFNSLWHPQEDPARLIQETVSMSSAARLADANKVSVATPYFQGRKDRKDKPRTNITAAEIAIELIEAGGAQRLLTMDLHAEANISSIVYSHKPWDLVYGSRVLVPEINRHFNNPTVVAPDLGAARRTQKYRDLLNVQNMAFVVKQRDLNTGATDSVAIIGDVGEEAVIVDDEIASGGTIWGAAEKIKDQNHGKGIVIAAATHAKFVPDKKGLTLPEKLNQPGCPIDHIIITDTIEQPEEIYNHEKITIVPTAGVFGIVFYSWMIPGEKLSKRLSMNEKLIY